MFNLKSFLRISIASVSTVMSGTWSGSGLLRLNPLFSERVSYVALVEKGDCFRTNPILKMSFCLFNIVKVLI